MPAAAIEYMSANLTNFCWIVEGVAPADRIPGVALSACTRTVASAHGGRSAAEDAAGDLRRAGWTGLHNQFVAA